MEITIRLAITDKTAFFVETDRTPFAEPRTDVLHAAGSSSSLLFHLLEYFLDS